MAMKLNLPKNRRSPSGCSASTATTVAEDSVAATSEGVSGSGDYSAFATATVDGGGGGDGGGDGGMKKAKKQSPSKPLKKILKSILSGGNKREGVDEARARAARLLEPPPFAPDDVGRLAELKDAKLRATERRIGSAGGSHRSSAEGDGDGDGEVSVSSSWAHSVSARGFEVREEPSSVGGSSGDATTFLACLTLHAALLLLLPFPPGGGIGIGNGGNNDGSPFTENIVLPLVLVALQSVALRCLLVATLAYAFDSVDFGQMELVKNMDYGKRLFVKELRKYSKIVSLGIALLSCGVSSGEGMVRALVSSASAGAGPWGTRAYEISVFLTTRMGVFVLALLLLGHMLLPKPSEKKGASSEAKISDDGKIMAKRKRHAHGGAPTMMTAAPVAAALSILLLATTAPDAVSATVPSSPMRSSRKAVDSILVAGSLNADTFLPVHRFPSPGENLTLLPGTHPEVDVPGGKGCNQAIACARLSKGSSTLTPVFFLGQFGNDDASRVLQDALVANDVDVGLCGRSMSHPSGRGYVMIVSGTGEVSAVVSGGSNLYGWGRWGVVTGGGSGDDEDGILAEEEGGDDGRRGVLTDGDVRDMVAPRSLLLLQCEVPHLVNVRLARAAREANVPVIVDAGGEDRRMGRDLLEHCDYLVPNETELERLAGSYDDDEGDDDCAAASLDGDDLEGMQARIGSSLDLPSMLRSVRTLQRNGANNVLVTLGSRGSMLVRRGGAASSLLYQPSCPLPPGTAVVDETGAGDCYRAGFAVALLEHCRDSARDDDDVDDEVLRRCMRFASAAGALAVTRMGAVPSIPSRAEVEGLLSSLVERDVAANGDVADPVPDMEAIPRGGGRDDDGFPFLFGSRLNSMKDRQDLVDPSSLPLATPRDYVRRQATIRGLGCVDFNFPQHFEGYWTPEEAKRTLDEVDLVAGAVCLRYPSKFARGAMNHPDPELRREAIEITKRAAEAARVLGCNEVVIWSAYDGYDYPFQVSYQEKWDQLVEAFRECCDTYPDIKWSLEYKPTDENTRFFTVPSTGAAMLLVKEIDRPNMGLTLDMGHMLMSGENPGQSIAMVGDKLFGIQLNDGYTRLAAEDGMMFGSIHPSIALEAMYQLRQIGFSGHLYFDTFPQRSDPVREAEYNIEKVKQFWKAVTEMDSDEVARVAGEHDAIGALELVNEALRR